MVIDYLQVVGDTVGREFVAVSIYAHYLHRISTGNQSNHVGTTVAAIVANQRTVYLGVSAVLATFDIYVVRLGFADGSPFSITALMPSLTFGNLDTIVHRLSSYATVSLLAESDVFHVAVVNIIGTITILQGNGSSLLVNAHVGEVLGVVILDVARGKLHFHLVGCQVLCHSVCGYVGIG